MKLGAKGARGQRTGWTTGACAAAAACAATVGLTTGTIPKTIEIELPNGARVVFGVVDGFQADDGCVSATVIKDAGDDPDCTHGARLVARVAFKLDRVGEVFLEAGEGVGRVTRPGLGLLVGQGAINPIPRDNIIANVREAAGAWLATHSLTVTIMVPGGEALAQKTLNPRLGILGGISILGTTGVVYPYSTSAYKAAVVQSIAGAVAAGLSTIVLTTGRRTERFAMQQFPSWPEWAFVQMGDFVGAALEGALAHGVTQVVIVAMGGKLAKMAMGVANTHAHKVELDMGRVAEIALKAGASEDLAHEIANGVTVRFAADKMNESGLLTPFYQHLAQSAYDGITPRLQGKVKATVLALAGEGHLQAMAGVPLP